MYKVNWKIFIKTGDAGKANKVFKAFIDLLGEDYHENIKPYHKGGFTASFLTTIPNTKWEEVVFEALRLAQKVGRSWVITGDIETEFDAWSDKPKLSGIEGIHIIVTKSESFSSN